MNRQNGFGASSVRSSLEADARINDHHQKNYNPIVRGLKVRLFLIV
jgi:hypothetical protein